MQNKEIHFIKTISLLEALQVDKNIIIDNIPKSGIEDVLKMAMGQKEIGKKLTKDNLKRLNEILAIEKEKFLLRDNEIELKEIQKKEISYYESRKVLLNQNFTDLINMEFVLSPLVNTYESDWEWIVRPALHELFEINIKDILNTDAKDYYFLFQRSCIYDDLLDTNLLEFPLNGYQYFFLRFFELPQTLTESIDRFHSEFEYKSQKEKQQLIGFTQAIIRDLIFRMLIVPHNG